MCIYPQKTYDSAISLAADGDVSQSEGLQLVQRHALLMDAG